MSESRGGLAGWKRPLLIVLATAPLLVVAFSFFFMWQYEAAFDESTCPFVEGEIREVADGVRVREDFRTCQAGVEEHRWVLLRDGRAPRPIALRALDAQQWDGYAWTAGLEGRRVRVEIRNPGHEPRVFREPAADAGAP